MNKLYDIVLKILKPFIKWWGKLHVPFSKKKINGMDYYSIAKMIRPGDVFLTKNRGEFSNIINPGKIKHAGMYLGYIGEVPVVIEAIGKGVVLTDLATFIMQKDHLIATRATYLHIEELPFLKEFAMKFLGTPYDYGFKSGNAAVYCFELCANILKGIRPEIELKREKVLKGVKIYSFTAFLGNKLFKTLYDTDAQ